MMATMKAWNTRLLLLAVFAGFLSLGLLFITRMGIEVDEALDAVIVYLPGSARYSWTIGSHLVPVMLLSYLGALKTWIYYFVFKVASPRPLTLRLPTLVLAGLTLWIFFRLLDEAVGRRAAWIGIALLATDTSFLMLNAAAFGPVT